MKRLWLAAALLGALFLATWANSRYLDAFSGRLIQLLTTAEARAEAEDWQPALDATQQAQTLWQARSVYLHTTQRHQDIDEILLGFREVEEFLRRQERGEYSAANAKLIGRLDLLREQEQLSLKNLL